MLSVSRAAHPQHFRSPMRRCFEMPRLYGSGVYGEWDYLAIELLGPSLDSLYRKSGKDTMDLRSVCSIAIQVVSHSESYIPTAKPMNSLVKAAATAIHAFARSAAQGYTAGQLYNWNSA